MSRAHWSLVVVTLLVCHVGQLTAECVVISPAGMKDWAQLMFAGRLEEKVALQGVTEVRCEVSRRSARHTLSLPKAWRARIGCVSD